MEVESARTGFHPLQIRPNLPGRHDMTVSVLKTYPGCQTMPCSWRSKRPMEAVPGAGGRNPYGNGIRTALAEAGKRHADAVERYNFYQFVFFRQWAALRDYAHQRGIQIIGDIPIFVAYDSADVWANPELFYLDETGLPTVVAGVPPDYFSQDRAVMGQSIVPLGRAQGDRITMVGRALPRHAQAGGHRAPGSLPGFCRILGNSGR